MASTKRQEHISLPECPVMRARVAQGVYKVAAPEMTFLNTDGLLRLWAGVVRGWLRWLEAQGTEEEGLINLLSIQGKQPGQPCHTAGTPLTSRPLWPPHPKSQAWGCRSDSKKKTPNHNTAYGGSQARGRIAAVAASLCHSHSRI